MKNAKWIMIGFVLAILLAGGAYFGTQALARGGDGEETAAISPNTDDGLSGLVMAGDENGMPESGVASRVEIEPAAGVPETEPEVFGFILQREDDTFLIGTGKPKISMELNDDGTPNIRIKSTEGPTIEVVVTRDTQLLEDASDMTALAIGDGGSMQQEVKSIDSLDDLAKDGQMMVWGTKRGERVVADVVLVIPPFVASGKVDQ
jgi:hypothetical protein